MRVLVFHGYLLRGTGSNVYNARLCAALARAGHAVDLLCQEPRPEELDFVDAVGTWEDGVVRVLANRCTHRGNRLCNADKGNSSSFRCPYHGWTFSNDGSLSGVPMRDGYAERFGEYPSVTLQRKQAH